MMRSFKAVFKLTLIAFANCIFFSNAEAKELKSYPNLSGNVLYQIQADRILSTDKKGVSYNNAFVYVEPNVALNFDFNWSVKTQWRLQPNNVLTTRNPNYPERYRTFLQSDRGLNLSDTGLLVEELKINFENEDLRFFAGKFDPTFGTAYRKSKRIGVFSSQFAEDYNLREKIGASISALLDGGQVSLNSFFNDTTDLSKSAINNRGRADRNGIAGTSSAFSSYSVAIEGENFLFVPNLFYNVGYRSLGVSSANNDQIREKGYVFGSEYLFEWGHGGSLIPFVELVKIDNFSGKKGRNAQYSTFALITKHSGWTASVSMMSRNIKKADFLATDPTKISDKQIQFSIGYKFGDNFTLDVTRANVKEGGNSAVVFGSTLSYLYKF